MGHDNPIAKLGEIVLLLTLVVTTYAAASSVAGARRGSRRLVDSGLLATYASTALLSLASSLIFFSILANDYTIKYVQRYSDATMPWYYKITSYWGGLDGSMMFWAWLLSIFAALAIYFNRERHRELIPWVAAILMVILDFFLILLIFEKRPFDTFLTDAPVAGKGLNPLLQNPYMATHPPSLYTGLVSAAVPFAFGLAALITGHLDDSWLRSVRRWVLVSWFFLSLGLTLGMLWAYEVLGWGGFWGWDPVENAGALAWFTETAFLHSVLVQERRGMLKVWNLFLVITSFLLTMVATFLTRSGIVQSVHAFGSDPVLKWSFLGFIVTIGVVGYAALLVRLPLLRSRGQLDSWVSREFAFMVNNWILLSIPLFILIATLFPSLSESITGSRITLATPFYTRFLAVPGLILIFLTGVGPLLAWRRATPENLIEQFAIPVATGLVTLVVLAFIPGMRATTPVFMEKWQFPVSLVCFSLCAFVTATITQEFVRGARVRQAHTKLDFFTSLIGLVARNKRRYGGYLVHMAIVLMFVGFAGGSYKKETEATLEKTQSTKLGRYTVRFDGFEERSSPERREMAARITVLVGGKEVAHPEPAKWVYPHHEEEPITKVEIERGMLEDLYLVLNGYDREQGVVSLKVVVNPLVNWIWVGFLLLAVGTGVAFSPERAYQLAESAARQGGKTASHAGTIALLLLALSSSVRAQEAAPGGMTPTPLTPMNHQSGAPIVAASRTPVENELFHAIVCTCSGCKRELLADCTCGMAAQARDRISAMLRAGKTKDEVLDAVGVAALAVHPDSWKMVAVVYSAMLLGAGGLVLLARTYSSKRGARNAPGPVLASSEKSDASDLGEDDYQDRLDDELGKLD